LKEWLAEQPECDLEIIIPDERPAFLPDNPLFELKVVSLGKTGKITREFHSRAQAELVFRLANLGISGNVKLPSNKESCLKLIEHLNKRIGDFRARRRELTGSRSTDERRQAEISELLEHWYVFGRIPSQGRG
jgi:hypothetical protein